MTIKVVSTLSENSDYTCRKITEYIGKQLGIVTEFLDNIPWQERHKMLDAQQVQLGWICGIDYVRKMDSKPPYVELVAAPVMQNPRYGQKPIYFSDVIVRRDRQYYSFADLRGQIMKMVRVEDFSYNIVRDMLRLADRVKL